MTQKKFNSGNKHQWQDDWDKDEQGELNEEELETTHGTLPDISRFSPLFVNEHGHPDTGAIQIGSAHDYIAVMYEGNDPNNEPGDNISHEEALTLAKELVHRYNEYEELKQGLLDADEIVRLTELQAFNLGKQNHLMLEALTQLLDRLTFHGSIDPIREEGPIEDARAAIKSATI